MKIGDLVKWTNPNSMAYGIECRVPYLDYDLADYSFKTNMLN